MDARSHGSGGMMNTEGLKTTFIHEVNYSEQPKQKTIICTDAVNINDIVSAFNDLLRMMFDYGVQVVVDEETGKHPEKEKEEQDENM